MASGYVHVYRRERALCLLGQWTSETTWQEQDSEHHDTAELHRGFSVGILQPLCEETGWMQAFILGLGPWLQSFTTRKWSTTVCLQQAPASWRGLV